jgi:hypothetical protein
VKAKKKKSPIQDWGKKIHWERRVKAVCKPCWEIKYCPYGPLVEDFPLKRIRDERSCRIFGHDCPVFSVAEPFTETRDLRNISRQIPRVTQFRVLKRENQICSICGKSVKDEDVEFDHIIPWIKGGSSDEYNIRLLCKDCNRKRGKKFEDEYLVDSLRNHLIEPVGIEILRILIESIKLTHTIYKKEKRYPSALDVCKFLGRRKVRDYDELTVKLIEDIDEFFNSGKPRELKQKVFKALKYRWGFSNREIHKLKESAKIFGVETEDLLSAELSLINRLGWQVKLTEVIKKKWLRC